MLNLLKVIDSSKNISVIIPVYNTAQYLEECLLSVLDQVDSKIEVIAIDDASSDQSYEILIGYQKRYPHLKVLQNSSNIGPGPTRNVGLEVAQGKYIAFLDSDDSVNYNYFACLLSSAEENESDIVYSGISPRSKAFEKFTRTYAPVSTDLNNLPVECRMTGIIGKLFCSDFLKKNNIKFLDEKIIIGEDIPFTWISYFCAEKISFAPMATYKYRMHGSGCHSVTDERILGIFKALKYVQTIYEKLDPTLAREELLTCLIISHIAYNYKKIQNVISPDKALIDRYKSEAYTILEYSEECVMNNQYIYQKNKEIYIELKNKF